MWWLVLVVAVFVLVFGWAMLRKASEISREDEKTELHFINKKVDNA